MENNFEKNLIKTGHSPSKYILIIEDEEEIADFVRRYLEREGYRVEIRRRGDDGLAAVLAEPPDLVVLDIMLPGMDGLEVLRRMRGEAYVPVILLTSKSDETDRVVGLEMGADDYVTKPFSPRELTARVKALFRRVEALRGNLPAGDTLKSRHLVLDINKRNMMISGNNIELTSTEYLILKAIMSRPGRVYSRDELLDMAWGEEFAGESRTVDVHVKNLRKKIKEAGAPPDVIKSVWGVGYKYED